MMSTQATKELSLQFLITYKKTMMMVRKSVMR
jgi:hypothetical protein